MKDFSTKLLQLLIDSENNIEALDNYYNVSNNAIKEEIAKQQEEKQYVIKCSDYLNEIFACKTKKGMESKKEEIGERLFYKNKRFKDIYTITSINKGAITYSIPANLKNKELFMPNEATSIINAFYRMITISSSSILSNEITLFEKYLSGVFSLLIKRDPVKYFSNQTIQIQDLLKSDSETIIKNEINKLVEKEMFDTIQLIRKIESKEAISLDSHNKVVKTFSEIYYRRNLFVHNDGIVNEIYLSKVNNKKIKIGETLECSDEYIKESFMTIQLLMFFICYLLLEKTETKFDENITNTTQDYFFKVLKNERYELLEPIYHYLSRCKKLDEDPRESCFVNYLICLKQQNKKELFDKTIANYNVDSERTIYVIAKHLLKGENEEAYKLIEEHYFDDGFITAIEIKEWPVFKEFRTTDFYKKLLVNHPKDFESFSLEGDN